MMKPILVRAFGRTGTTLLMQLLGTSNDIFVPNDYPFESRYLTYFSRMTKLFDESCLDQNYRDGDVLDFNRNLLGNCPYKFSDIVDSDEMRRRLLHGLWNQFSQSVFSKENKNYQFYAEKVALEVAPYINASLPDVNNIFLVRDPRGELASIISFNKKRGFNGFGWQDDDTEMSFATKMIESRKQYFNSLSGYDELNKNIIILRFEDVVENLKGTADKLEKFLNVKIDFNSVVNNVSNMSHHMTSSSISDSSSKWKKELSKDVISFFEEEMHEELKLFGYV